MSQGHEHTGNFFDYLVGAFGIGFALVICLVSALWAFCWFLVPFFIFSINAHLRAIRYGAGRRP